MVDLNCKRSCHLSNSSLGHSTINRHLPQPQERDRRAQAPWSAGSSNRWLEAEEAAKIVGEPTKSHA